MSTRQRIGRALAPLIALICVGLGIGFLMSQDVPMGTVRGVVVMSESGKPLEDAELYLNPVNDNEDSTNTDEAQKVRRSRQVSTDAEGQFTFSHVPAGKYHLSANSSYHHVSDVTVTVREAQSASVTLRLDRTGDDLAIGARQAVWSLQEKPMLPVRGFIDPKKGDFDALHLRVWRSRLSTLVQSAEGTKAIDSMDRTSDGTIDKMSDALLDPPGLLAIRPKLVESEDIPIQAADREGFYEQRLPIPASGPGLYLVEVRHGKKAACSYVLSTSMALVVKRADTQLVAYAVDMMSGTPVSGADVRQYRDGTIVAHGATDANGVADLTLPAIPKKPSSDDDSEDSESQVNSRQLTVVVRGDDEAVLNRGDWTDTDRQDDFAVHAYTDRTVYRPGQSISYKAILRQRNDPKSTGLPYRVPAGEPVTVEVRDPQGDRILSESKTTNRWGTLSGSFDLSKEAPTGIYSLVCKVRGEKHASDVAVASYRKPEFAVTVAPKQSHYTRGDTVEMKVSAQYYFGAPVAGATVQYDVYRDSDWAAIYGSDYDPDSDSPDEADRGSYYGRSVAHGSVTLDANGEAVVSVPTSRKHQKPAPSEGGDSEAGGYDASAETPDEEVLTCHATVTDDAKRQVEADGTAHLAAGAFALTLTPEGYLGSPGKPTSIVLSATDHDGKPVAGAQVYLSAIYQDWNSKTSAIEKTNAGPAQKAVTGAGGRVVLSVTPKKAGELQLVATAYDAQGRALHARSNLYVAGSDGSDMQTEYSDLSLLTDKKKYGPGDVARILINTARVGETVLLTVEGDRVYHKSVVPISHKSTVITLPIEASWGPNVTLSACYVQKKKFAKSETPLRVRLDARTIAVTIQSNHAQYRPGDKATYTIHTTDARSGRPVASELSLAVVDESIFALRADTPNALRDAFYPHRTNRVTTLYSFDVAYLGDTDKSEPTIEMRRKFLDTAYWQPHLETDANGNATATVSLPDNLTTWRATVQALSMDTSVGRATEKVLVAKPFFLRLDTPRFLTQNDDGRLLTLIHNNTGAAQNVHVRLTAHGLIPQSSEDTKTLQVVPGTDGQIEWPISAQIVGSAAIKAEAWTDGVDPANGKPFTDGIETSLPVRAFGREQFTSIAGVITDSASDPSAGVRTLTLDDAALVSESKLTVRITPSVSGALAPALDYLTGYPYGCTEQTMSRILPDLLVARTAKITGHALLTGPDGAKRMAALPRMVKDGISRLRRFQHPTGAWGWWESDADDPFLTAYVLAGLAYAKYLGYDVPPKMREQGIKGATEMLKKASPNDRPFLMYALVMNGERGESLRLLHAVSAGRDKMAGMELDKLAPDSLAYLVLLAQHLKEDYRPALHQLERREVGQGRLLHWTNDQNRWRSSDRMATALAMRAYLAVNPADYRITNILRYLMASRTDDEWGDTRDTSFVLNGLMDYLGYHPEDAAPPSGTVAVKINGVDVQDFNLASSSGTETELLVRVPASTLHKGENRFEIARSGGGAGAIFYTGALHQIVAAPESGILPATSFEGVTVTREYLKLASHAVGPSSWALVTGDVPGNKFRQDDHIRVRLTVKAPKDIDYVLIEDEYPSNLEVTERGTAEAALADGDGATTDWYDNVDVRDDRIAFFAAKLTKGTHTIEYNLRAQTPGVCRALPALVQAMYAPEIRAESTDSRIEVTK